MRITPAVEIFMVVKHNGDQSPIFRTFHQQCGSQRWMGLNQLIFMVGKQARLRKDVLRDTQFADVMQQAASSYDVNLFLW